MQSEVMFAGFGGQGILLIGKILAHAAMEQGYEVGWIPSYGPEMRGGNRLLHGGHQRPADWFTDHSESAASGCNESPFSGKIRTAGKTGGGRSGKHFPDFRQYRT